MGKMIVVDPGKCVSCRSCEVACSFKRHRTFAPSRARIQAVSFEDEGISVPVLCYQCTDAPCEKVCPVKAISLNAKGVYKVDYELCIGCKLCVIACPFGNMAIDPIDGKVIKCDHCDGTPQCVQACPHGALAYQEQVAVAIEKRRSTAEKFLTFIGKEVE